MTQAPTLILSPRAASPYSPTGWAVALGLHALLLVVAVTLDHERPTFDRSDYVPVDVVEVAPPEPAPAPEPEPEPEPAPKPEPRKIEKVVDLTKTPPVASTPPPTESSPDAEPDALPVFGLGRKSFGTSGSFKVRTGNTVGIRPEDSAETDIVKALKPVPTYQVTSLPRIIGQPKPAYPPALRSAGVEGDVILELLIDVDGKVALATVVESSNEAFNTSALDAAYQLKFAPAQQGKSAVAVKIRFPVKFRLT